MPDPEKAQKTILVVEDDDATRSMIAATLQHAGYNVTCATGRTEVLALVSFHPFDLVITDVIMPEVDGTEVISALRRNRPATPVIAISGGGSLMTGEFSLKLAKGVGAGISLMKPFRLEDLLRAVGNALTGEVPPASRAK